MASPSKAQDKANTPPAKGAPGQSEPTLTADMHALVTNEYGSNDPVQIELKRAASPGGDSDKDPKRVKPTPGGPENTPPKPTPPATMGVTGSPNPTPPGPKGSSRASLGGQMATEFLANLQQSVDSMARAAIARTSKDSVFTETVREQVKEVGKTAGRIYNHMEWVDKGHTNSVATLNMLRGVHQWNTAITEQLNGVWRQLTDLGGMLAQVLEFLRTCPAPPSGPTYQAPAPYTYPHMWGNAPGNYYATPAAPVHHPPAPVNPHDPRTRPDPVPAAPVVPPAPVMVSQAAPVAPAPAASAPVAPEPPVATPPVAAPSNPKPTGPGAAATTSTGLTAPKRKQYPTDRILVVKTARPDHFLTEFMTHLHQPLLTAGFKRRTIAVVVVVESWRPFTKRGYPKRTWAMCFGSVEDTNATWTEYLGIRDAVLAQGLIVEKCKPKSEAVPASMDEHVETTTQHTRAIAEAAAAELAPIGGGRTGDELMRDIADIIYKRMLKGKEDEA